MALNRGQPSANVEPNHYIILAVDGQGGSSVTLYDNGEIVNQPCWWFADEREISDIVYIEKPQSDAQDDTQTEVQDETQSDAQTE